MRSCLKDYTRKNVNKLINDISDLQLKINKENDYQLKEQKSSEEIKNEIIPLLMNSLFNSFKNIWKWLFSYKNYGNDLGWC